MNHSRCNSLLVSREESFQLMHDEKVFIEFCSYSFQIRMLEMGYEGINIDDFASRKQNVTLCAFYEFVKNDRRRVYTL